MLCLGVPSPHPSSLPAPQLLQAGASDGGPGLASFPSLRDGSAGCPESDVAKQLFIVFSSSLTAAYGGSALSWLSIVLNSYRVVFLLHSSIKHHHLVSSRKEVLHFKQIITCNVILHKLI